MLVKSLSSVSEKMQERSFDRSGLKKNERKKIDAKVQGAVQRKIVGGVGSLLVSLVTPLLLPTLRSSIRNMFRSIRQTKLIEPNRGLGDTDFVPLGLSPCGSDSWMNAAMQIMLRLPMFKAVLTLWAPQSYEPFQRFIDQYEADRKAHFPVSSASSVELVNCLLQKMESNIHLSPSHLGLFKIFQTILLSFHSVESLIGKGRLIEESCYLLEWDPQTQALQPLIHKKIGAHMPRHLLIFVKERSEPPSMLPKQFSEGEKGGYYDLHGFIERRHEAGLAEFIAYVKVAGQNWYQCRNQRISKLRSIHLDLPLLSSRLFYYKRCSYR